VLGNLGTLAFDSVNDALYITTSDALGAYSRVRVISNVNSGVDMVVSTLSGDYPGGLNGLDIDLRTSRLHVSSQFSVIFFDLRSYWANSSRALNVHFPSTVVAGCGKRSLHNFDGKPSTTLSFGTNACFENLNSIKITGNLLFVSDMFASNIRKIHLDSDDSFRVEVLTGSAGSWGSEVLEGSSNVAKIPQISQMTLVSPLDPTSDLIVCMDASAAVMRVDDNVRNLRGNFALDVCS
jgi:hypothetical protein